MKIFAVSSSLKCAPFNQKLTSHQTQVSIHKAPMICAVCSTEGAHVRVCNSSVTEVSIAY